MRYSISVVAFYALVLLQNLAWGKRIPWGLFSETLGSWGRWFWVLLTLGFVVWLIQGQPLGRLKKSPLFKNPDWILRALCIANLGVLCINYKWFEFLGYHFPALGVLIAAGCLFFIRFDRPWVSAILCLGVLISAIIAFPLTPPVSGSGSTLPRSDMLIVIERAWSVLKSGGNPFTLQSFSWGTDRMPYLFGIFISHAPAALLGIDLRWNQLLYRLIWSSLILKHLKKHPSPQSTWVAHLLWLNPYFNYRHDLYAEVFLLSFILFWALTRMRFLTGPFLMLTRQWAWILVPFYALAEKQKLRTTLFTWGMGGIFLTLGMLSIIWGFGFHPPLSEWKPILLDFVANKGIEQLGVMEPDFGLSFSWLIQHTHLLTWQNFYKSFVFSRSSSWD